MNYHKFIASNQKKEYISIYMVKTKKRVVSMIVANPAVFNQVSLIFSYIRRLEPFSGFKILSFSIFGSFQKNYFFLGYDEMVDIFRGSSQIWTVLGVISIHFRAFSYSQGTVLEWF